MGFKLIDLLKGNIMQKVAYSNRVLPLGKAEDVAEKIARANLTGFWTTSRFPEHPIDADEVDDFTESDICGKYEVEARTARVESKEGVLFEAPCATCTIGCPGTLGACLLTRGGELDIESLTISLENAD